MVKRNLHYKFNISENKKALQKYLVRTTIFYAARKQNYNE